MKLYKPRPGQRSHISRTKPSSTYEPVNRTCLRCERDFIADGYYQRLCRDCRTYAERAAR